MQERTKQLSIPAVAAAVLKFAVTRKEVAHHSGRSDDLYRRVCASMGHPVSYACKWAAATITLYSHDDYATISGDGFDWKVSADIAKIWYGRP